MRHSSTQTPAGFTLIELLVVIATIGTLVAFISINWISARSRGQDHQKKTELQAIQQALLVYQLRFGQFPTTTDNDVTLGFDYYPCDSGTTYRLKTQLNNASDLEIHESQARCPAASCGLSYSPTEYVVCHN